MTSPNEYVNVYLNIPFEVDGTWYHAQIRNYLQNGLGTQSSNALAGKKKLTEAMARLPAATLSAAIGLRSINRVYDGKGSPGEIQGVLRLLVQCKLVDATTLASYCDTTLGVDCGGFVANYWGFGMPAGNKLVEGEDGMIPRTFWDSHQAMQRKLITDVQPGDAIIFFEQYDGKDPDNKAQKINGKWSTNGSKAHHIGLVNEKNIAGDTAYLSISDSSEETSPSSGGNGVKTTNTPYYPIKFDAKKRVYLDTGGKDVLFFLGPHKTISPYELTYSYTAVVEEWHESFSSTRPRWALP